MSFPTFILCLDWLYLIDVAELNDTGNNVGKTTVLKLIDFCFGANAKIIFKQIYFDFFQDAFF